jgi:hypothetical protein
MGALTGRRLGDTDPFTDLNYRLALRQLHFHFSEMLDDLLHRETLA